MFKRSTMSNEPECPITQIVCPRNSDPKKGTYCPAWTEYIETNVETGEERIMKECFYSAMPKYLHAAISAANRPAAATESLRNEIVKGFSHLSVGIQQLPQLVTHRRERRRNDDLIPLREIEEEEDEEWDSCPVKALSGTGNPIDNQDTHYGQ